MEVVLGSNKLLNSDVVNCYGHPWLLVCDERKKEKEKIMFFNLIERRYYLVSIPNSSDMSLWFCGNLDNCWLLFENYDKSGPNFLLNLMSMERLQLPQMVEVRYKRKSCIVTAPPTDPNCKVIIIESGIQHLFLWQPGQDQFVKQTFIIDDDDIDDFSILAATSFKGMIYALTIDDGLAKADYENPCNFEILWNTGLPIQIPRVGKGFDYLLEVDDQLLYIYQPMMGDGSDGVLDFIIYKANFQDMKWEKLHNINDNAIFLNRYQGFAYSVKGNSGIKRNSIYFTSLLDRDFYIFNLEDKSVSVLPTSTKISIGHSNLFWVMLPCQN